MRKKLGLILKDCQIPTSGIRRVIDGSLAHLKRTDRLAIVTAIDEVISNIVRHGSSDGQGNLKIDIYQSRNKVKIVIEDNSRPFDPTLFKCQPYDEIIEKGIEGHIGLRIVHKVMSRINYKRFKGKNRLILEKSL